MRNRGSVILIENDIVVRPKEVAEKLQSLHFDGYFNF